jgi:hypothetical protein
MCITRLSLISAREHSFGTKDWRCKTSTSRGNKEKHLLLPHHAISALFETNLFVPFRLVRESVFAALMNPRIDSKTDDQKAEIRTTIDIDMPIETLGS